MGKEHILVIEDEEDILALLHYNLIKEGFKVTCAQTGEEGLNAARAQSPDLIVLDLMLPGIDGLQVCRALKSAKATAAIPVVMLTAKGEEHDIVTGLELGADDYVTKPFSPRVLSSRLKAVLRRRERDNDGPTDESESLHIGPISIHPGRNQVLADGQEVDLTFTEFRVLYLLARRPGWVFTRYQIVNAVRGDDYSVTDRAVDVQIVGLRKKLGPAGKIIETVRGVGYRCKDQ